MDRLLKYIPAESVALYLTLQGIVLSSVEGPALNTWLWFAFGIRIIGTPLYLWRVQQVSERMQLAVSTTAFGVWVFALGGAFEGLLVRAVHWIGDSSRSHLLRTTDPSGCVE